jgi:hypothetical protein
MEISDPKSCGMSPQRSAFHRPASSVKRQDQADFLAPPLLILHNHLPTYGFRDQEFFMLEIYALHESRYELVG